VLNGHPDCDEAGKVIEVLAIYAKAYVSQDYKTCAEYMTDGITTFDERTKKLIVGKQAVLADMKARLDAAAPDSDSPLLSYTIKDPLAHVSGDCCTINCLGVKVYGGKHPRTMESHSSYCFIKEDGKWKKSHFRTDWKQVDAPKS
jgi:ketosteroid isomerase-like protein